MRLATKKDHQFIAQCFIETSKVIKSIASDIYIDGMPDTIDAPTYNIASDFIEKDNAISLITERNNKPIACLLGKIGKTSFPPSGLNETRTPIN
ncbi:MAG: hypothetical protein ABW168_29120 [Sedimenticola sp.]